MTDWILLTWADHVDAYNAIPADKPTAKPRYIDVFTDGRIDRPDDPRTLEGRIVRIDSLVPFIELACVVALLPNE